MLCELPKIDDQLTVVVRDFRKLHSIHREAVGLKFLLDKCCTVVTVPCTAVVSRVFPRGNILTSHQYKRVFPTGLGDLP